MSQDPSIQEVIPPTPDVYSLGKFGEYPVANNYGTIPISIPLLELKSGDIVVPISISYHTGGLKVNEEASSVGLGWALNAGGVISKSVRGANDRDYGRYMEDQQNNTSFIFDGANALDMYYNVRPTLSFEDDNDKAFFINERIIGEEEDGQSDNYFFNFFSHSGKFVFKGGGVNDIMIYPVQQNLKIKFEENGYSSSNPDEDGVPGSAYWDKFYIQDDSGFEYWFGDQEYYLPSGSIYKSASSWHLSKIHSQKTGSNVNYNYTIEDYTKISYGYYNDYEKSTCSTNYLQDGYSTNYVHKSNMYVSEFQTKAYSEIISDDGSKIVFEIENGRDDIYKLVGGVAGSGGGFRYKSISLVNADGTTLKKVVFNHTYFSSVENTSYSYPHSVKRLRLDSIEIYGEDLINPEQTYVFEYNNDNIPNLYSLCQDRWGYYNGKDYDKILPSVDGILDYEGANLNSDPNYMDWGILDRIYYPTGGYTEFEFEANTVEIHNTVDNETANIFRNFGIGGNNSMICGSLGSENPYIQSNVVDVTGVIGGTIDITIDFPEIQTSEFQYAPNLTVNIYGLETTYSYTISMINENGFWKYPSEPFEHRNLDIDNIGSDEIEVEIKYDCDDQDEDMYAAYVTLDYDVDLGQINENYDLAVGGLRIKKHTDKGESGQVLQTTEYSYQAPDGYSSGDYIYAGGTPSQWNRDQALVDNRVGEGTCGQMYITRVFTYPIIDLNYSGSPVCYAKVTKKLSDTSNQLLGKTEYLYSTTKNGNSVPLGFPWAPLSDQSYKRTLLTKKDYNTNDDIVSQEDYLNNYTPLDESKQLLLRGTIAFDIDDGNQLTGEKDYYLAYYDYWKDAVTYSPDPNAPGTPIGEWKYENNYSINNYYLSKTTVTSVKKDLNGQNPITTVNEKFYDDPNHLKITNSKFSDSKGVVIENSYRYPIDINSEPYTSMKDMNMHNFPVEQTVERNSKVVSSKLITYKLDDGHYVPDEAFTLKTAVPLATFTQFNGTAKDNNYDNTPDVTFIDYNTNGKLTKSQTKDGLYTYYVWAYNGQYPVAKVVSSNNVSISTTITDASLSKTDVLADIQNGINYLETQLLTYINDNDYRVTLFTYKPLVGMTSQTDPNGKTTYYEYDDFGRLKTVKDDDGNILNAYDYHYSSSN